MKKAIIIIITAIAVYTAVFVTDRILILNEKSPVFCIEKENTSSNTYYGLGYSYEVCTHPVTGRKEHAMYLLGQLISSDITNNINVTEPSETATEGKPVSDISAEITSAADSLPETSANTDVQTVYQPAEERSNIVVVSSYRNWAWGYQHSGTFIDFEGKVYEFDFSDEEIKNDIEFVERLEAYYHSSDLNYSQKVSDPALVSEIAALSDLISPNAEITKEHAAYDAGQNTIYLLNSENELVKIYSDGDYTEINTDKHAEKAMDICRKL